MYLVLSLRAPRRRLAGVERGSRLSQALLYPSCDRVRATEHASGGPVYLLERRHGLVKIVERGAVVLVERRRVTPPHREREIVTLSEYTPRHGRQLAQEFTGFSVALPTKKERRVVVGFWGVFELRAAAFCFFVLNSCKTGFPGSTRAHVHTNPSY